MLPRTGIFPAWSGRAVVAWTRTVAGRPRNTGTLLTSRSPVIPSALPPACRDVALLTLYGLGFALTHALAARWSGDGFYSLWFPAAGLRLALLWRAGERFTLPAATVELVIDLLTGAVTLVTRDWPMVVLGVVRPVIGYGVAVWAIRRIARRPHGEGALFTAPMPFALASVGAPLLAALLAMPQAWLRPDLTGVESVQEVLLSLSAFAVGDLLGVLLVAPPLLWAADRLFGHARAPLKAPRLLVLVEAVAILALGLGAGAGLAAIGLGLQPAPALVAIAWVGLRLGRVGAWAALLIVAAIVLPLTAGEMATGARLQLHLGLATIAVAGYLAGSFADAQVRAREDLARRDRLLFQAERLKTLRAMSVAVIHEISQPLSTLSIEARHLHESARDASPEVAATAALIHAKATQLADLVRRLRRYGGRAVDEPTPLPLGVLIESVLALARPETAAAGVGLAVASVDADLVVVGQEVELAQALVNLIRNAAQACGPGGEVMLAATRDGHRATITVTNRIAPDAPPHPGMGVGTLIARAIVEAHGGTLARTTDAGGTVRAALSLPLLDVGEPA